MADWRRRSIAGGPSPATPNGDIPGALHLDFFYRPGATRTAFPSDEAGGTRELEAATMPTLRLSNAITDEAFPLPAADGDRRMAVTPPATMDEASPLQSRQRQAGGGGSRRRLSWSAHGSSGRVSSPTSSQLPPLPDHVAVNDEAGEEEEEEAVWPSSDEDFEEDDTLYVQNDDEDQAKSSGRREGHSEGGDEGTSSGRGDENDEAMSPERGEEDDEGGAMSPGREEDEDDENDEDDWDAEEEEEEEQEEQEEEEEEEEEEDEEEEPKSPPRCFDCGTMENLVMLMPCRHSCYCKPHFIRDGRRSGPGRLHCPICGHKYTEGHPQVGGLGPAKK